MAQPTGLLGRDEEPRPSGLRSRCRALRDRRAGGVGEYAARAPTPRASSAPTAPSSTWSRARAAATIPFGAVSHLLPDGGPPPIAEFTSALRRRTPRPGAHRARRRRPPAGRCVGRARCSRSPPAAWPRCWSPSGAYEPAPDAITRLWRRPRTRRPGLDLQPLSEGEVEQLGRPGARRPQPRAGLRLDPPARRGQPALRQRARVAARPPLRSALVSVDGRWHLTEGRAPFERLQDVLGAHIASVTGAGAGGARASPRRRGADAAPCSSEDLVLPGGGLEGLERSRLRGRDRRSAPGPARQRRPPAVRRVSCDTAFRRRGRRIRRRLAGALARHGTDAPAERLRIARLLLESGQVDEEGFLARDREIALAPRRGRPRPPTRRGPAPGPLAALPRPGARRDGPLRGGRRRARALRGRCGPSPPGTTRARSSRRACRACCRGPGDRNPIEAGQLITRAEGGRHARRRLAGAHRERPLLDRGAQRGALRHRVRPRRAGRWPITERRPRAAVHLLLAYGLALTRLGRVDEYTGDHHRGSRAARPARSRQPPFDALDEHGEVRLEGGRRTLTATSPASAGARWRSFGVRLDGGRADRAHPGCSTCWPTSTTSRATKPRPAPTSSGRSTCWPTLDPWNLRAMGHLMLPITLSHPGRSS